MELGSISDPGLSGTALSFTATANIDLIAVPSEPGNFPVLQDFSCSQTPPVQAQCHGLYPVESYCQLSSLIPGDSSGVIPFCAAGANALHQSRCHFPGRTALCAAGHPSKRKHNVDRLGLPGHLDLHGCHQPALTQQTFLLMPLLLRGAAEVPHIQIIADLSLPSHRRLFCGAARGMAACGRV